MDCWRKYTVVGLIVCLVQLTLADLTMARGAKSSDDTAAIKQKVEMFGVGAKVEMTIKGGQMMRGTIQSITNEDFALTSKGSGSDRRIAYDQVERLTLTKLTYKASGQPDPAEARRVVAGWGVGKKIRVTLVDGRTLKGVIQSMDGDSFTLLANGATEPNRIAYGNVQQVGTGGMSTGTSWAILGGAVGGVVIVLAVLFSQMGG